MNLRPAYVAGALTITIPASALALTQAQSLAQTPPPEPPNQTTSQLSGSPVRLDVPTRQLNARQGHSVVIRGTLDPGAQGQTVELQGQTVELQGSSGGAWHVLSSTETAADGSFALRYQASKPGSQQLQVGLAGGGSAASVTALAGRLTVFRQSIASWYDDGGDTACGFHAAHGVASPTLPCGTRVAFLVGGRRVSAVVDDRGPFVPGRDWDLDQATAGALGFEGVGPVWSSA